MAAKVLIANRGEIALRIVRACRDLGVESVVVYSEADRDSLAVRFADEAVCIGPAPASESYLRTDRLLSAAQITGATAIHPGYGFLSENAQFAALCEECGLTFVGPTSESIRMMGNKSVARKLMQEAGVPVTPGSDGDLPDVHAAYSCAERLKYPVILKASSGGGGKGMRVVRQRCELEQAYRSASQEAEKGFGDGSLFMEKFSENPKHVEVQILGDGNGHVVHLGERDCSLQRRHQKLIEESPCSSLSSDMRAEICEMAVRAGRRINYKGAGTIEFLVNEDGSYYFMEMNTRIQVEHPVTEMVTGIDLVSEQLKIALGEGLSMRQEDVVPRGHAIEIRLNAEDSSRNFAPVPGTVRFYGAPGGPGVRMDSCIYSGCVVTPYYDSMLGKLIVHGATRSQAIQRAYRALNEFVVEGIPTTRDFALELLASPQFLSGVYTTRYIEAFMAERL